MRWLLIFIVILAVLWFIRGIDEKPPPTAEESFIGEPVKVLRKMEGYEDQYLDATRERQKQMEEQIEKDTGGG
ncbi:MAG: hypothetical protein OQJ84_04085 [Xanthomonadales bacterium]|nr:hypothetical protein [Xanthomonadales bacterium]